MKTYTANSLSDLPVLAEKLLNDYSGDKIFALYGKMGSGKTTFIKSLCKQLGVEDVITSPTFALINVYTGKADKIYHFDFYRIESQEEVYDLGYEEYFFDNKYCFIEWPELVENLLPENYIKITITEGKDGIRTFQSEKVSFL
jgi:tRNA threonylcarbamoyladenosine biosynthesis protein TsaE